LFGKTPLQIAVKNGSMGFVEALCEAKADIYVIDEDIKCFLFQLLYFTLPQPPIIFKFFNF